MLTKENCTLTNDEIAFIKTRQKPKQLILAILLKYYQQYQSFPNELSNIPDILIGWLAQQLQVPSTVNKISSRNIDNFYALIRKRYKSSFAKKIDYVQLTNWLKNELLPQQHMGHEEIKNQAILHFKKMGVDSFKEKSLLRAIKDAANDYENELVNTIYSSLSSEQEANLNGLLLHYKEGLAYLGWLNKDFANPALDSILNIMEQLSVLRFCACNLSAIENLPRKRILHYAETFTRFNPSDLKGMTDAKRCAYLLLYCYARQQQLTDKAVDMFTYLSGSIIQKSERRVIQKLINDVKKVSGKETILFNIAEICILSPDSTIREKIFPKISQEKLQSIIDEYKKKGSKYQNILHKQIRSSYASYYRRMVPAFIKNIALYCNNQDYQPILDGLSLIKKYFDSGKTYFPASEKVPLQFLPSKWRKRIVDKETGKIKRICYEVYLFKKLGDRIKCREIWVKNAFKHHNPDHDLPKGFEENKVEYFAKLSLPLDADHFINSLQAELKKALSDLNNTILFNSKVRIESIKGGRIVVSPLAKQADPHHITLIKKHLQTRWQSTNLLDILKEAQIRLDFTSDFVSYGEKIYLTPLEISERILLNIYGFGTNVGLKYVCSGNPHISYSQLKHIKNYFLTADNMRNALGKIANALFNIRFPEIWGEMPVAVAGDSTQFSAYFQNLISEYHNRYGGRGVMIYWHVEKNACCIYSQLKSVSSSEVASMIEGILRHCTEMAVEKSYVDTHGQSEVGFAFAHLLGFNLMPRLANLNKQKLVQCELGDYQKYINLQLILGDSVDWQLIREQYAQMVKYAAIMKEGYADPDSVLRRFTRNNLKHPTYLALAQLGKVIKTIFICNYLMNETMRQEINAGLNVIELWNGVSKFIFYGRAGEISSNHEKNQELSVLSLHLLQLCMVYVNTLMIQQILLDYNLLTTLTPEDKRALTPLIYEHINPYGLFPLNLSTRLPHIMQEVDS